MNKIERLPAFDVAKGLGIMLIVLGHSGLQHSMHNWIYSFHVPLFFFISGCFLNRSRGFFQTLGIESRRLLVPLFVTMAVGHLSLLAVFCLSGSYQGPDVQEWIVKGILNTGEFLFCGMWFIWALFWTKCILSLTRHVGHWWIELLLSVALFLIGNYIADWGRNSDIAYSDYLQSFSFVRGLTAVVFVYAGSLFMNSPAKSLLANAKVQALSVLILLFAAWFPIAMYGFFYPLSALNILTSLLIVIAVLAVSTFFVSRFPDAKGVSVMKFYGNHTLLILCIHCVVHTLHLHVRLALVVSQSMEGIVEVAILGIAVWVISRSEIFCKLCKK